MGKVWTFEWAVQLEGTEIPYPVWRQSDFTLCYNLPGAILQVHVSRGVMRATPLSAYNYINRLATDQPCCGPSLCSSTEPLLVNRCESTFLSSCYPGSLAYHGFTRVNSRAHISVAFIPIAVTSLSSLRTRRSFSVRSPDSATQMPAEPRLSASLAVVNNRNEILLVQRNTQATSFAGIHVSRFTLALSV
jgi:hypothetical protein